MDITTPIEISKLETMTKEELLEVAKELGVTNCSNLKKKDCIMKLLQAQTEQQGNIFASGILEIMPDGYGFLRQESLLPGSTDVYISQSQIRRFGLRTGDMVTGQSRPPKAGEKYASLLRVEAINDINPEVAKDRPSSPRSRLPTPISSSTWKQTTPLTSPPVSSILSPRSGTDSAASSSRPPRPVRPCC